MMHLLKQLYNTLETPKSDCSASAQIIPVSDAYSTLKNERRRHIVTYLATMEGSVTDAGKIADHLAQLGDDRTACYISITQHHAQQLEASGYIEYDERAKTVRVLAPLEVLYEAHKSVLSILS